MKIMNLTPHSIVFVVVGDRKIVVEPSGLVARVSSKTEAVGEIVTPEGTIPVTQTVFGEVENLPEPEDGKVFIVSSLVAQRVPEREDVFIPNESVRDSNGRIIGCKSLGHI